ncbi:VanZ family protein [Bacillus gobiensis]|uniref:VanZ family protein n=1 Tax=Bacillus gobiensis TaxID=1441095 RepID=UPI003D25A81D
MLLALILLFMGFMLVLICTESFQLLMRYHHVSFNLHKNPNLSSFFDFNFAEFQSNDVVIQKAGHTLCFFILVILFTLYFRSLKSAVAVSIAFAFFTEIVQMFFGRHGCLRDVIIDSIGIFLFVIIYTVFSLNRMTPMNRSSLK